MTLRVVEWSTGTLGRMAIEGIDARPELELVGVYVSNPDKVGIDAGVLAGMDRSLGIRASSSVEELLNLKPDCIVYTAQSEGRFMATLNDFERILRAGINLIASGPVLLQYPFGILPDEIIKSLSGAARESGVTAHINGIDPGFANDVLPIALSSLSQRIDSIRVSEIADYSRYHNEEVMRELFGFGMAMDETPKLLKPGSLSGGWGSVIRQIAAALHVTLDEPLIERSERQPAQTGIDVTIGHIAEGTQASLRFEVAGQVDGVDRIIVEHVSRTQADQVPHWPTPDSSGSSYRIEIAGDPHMRVEFTHLGRGGCHNDSGMRMTAMRLVNSVEAICALEPGMVYAIDMPLIAGRGLMSCS